MKGKTPDMAEAMMPQRLGVVGGRGLGHPGVLLVEQLLLGLLEVALPADDLRVVVLVGAPGGQRLDVVDVDMLGGQLLGAAPTFALVPEVERLAPGLGEGGPLERRGEEGGADLANKVADGLALELDLAGLAKLEDVLVAELLMDGVVHVDREDDAPMLLLEELVVLDLRGGCSCGAR